jgi:hypothetical protein
MSVVVLVLDDVVLLVVTTVVVGTVVVGGSAHDGVAVQLHIPDLHIEMMPFRQSRLAFFLKPAQRALMAGLHFLGLHGFFRASTDDAAMPSPRMSPTSASAKAASLTLCFMSPHERSVREWMYRGSGALDNLSCRLSCIAQAQTPRGRRNAGRA